MSTEDGFFRLQEEQLKKIEQYNGKISGMPQKEALLLVLDSIRFPECATVIITTGPHRGVVGEDVGDLGKGLINVEIEEGATNGCIGIHEKNLINIFELKKKAGIIKE